MRHNIVCGPLLGGRVWACKYAGTNDSCGNSCHHSCCSCGESLCRKTCHCHGSCDCGFGSGNSCDTEVDSCNNPIIFPCRGWLD